MPRYKTKNTNPWFIHLVRLVTVVLLFTAVMDLVGLWGAAGSLEYAIPAMIGLTLALFDVLRFRKNYVELGDDGLTWVRWGWRTSVVPYACIAEVRRQDRLIKLTIDEPVAKGPARWRLGWLGGPADPGCLLLEPEDADRFLWALRSRLETSAVRFAKDEAERPDAQEPVSELIPADRWRRLLALVLDGLVLLGTIPATIALVSVRIPEGARPPSDIMGHLVLAAWFLYIWAANATGASLGKFLLRIKVIRVGTDARPGSTRGLVRAIASALSVACFGLGYLWCLWDRDRRGWHDILTQTRVVQTAAVHKPAEEPVQSAGS